MNTNTDSHAFVLRLEIQANGGKRHGKQKQSEASMDTVQHDEQLQRI